MTEPPKKKPSANPSSGNSISGGGTGAIPTNNVTLNPYAKKTAKDEQQTPAEKKRLKEERRLLQESQRAAKAVRKGGGEGGAPAGSGSSTLSSHFSSSSAAPGGSNSVTTISSTSASIQHLNSATSLSVGLGGSQTSGLGSGGGGGGGGPGLKINPAQRHQSAAKPNKIVPRTESQRKVPLFLHLKQYEGEDSLTKKITFGPGQAVHRSVVSLGLRYAEGVIRGADARAIAMMQTFADLVRDFSTPKGESFSRSLTKLLAPNFDFLTSCRPHSISMGNAFFHLKREIARIPLDMPEEEAKRAVVRGINDFVRANIVSAAREIAEAGAALITDGDVVLTYSRSSVVESVLLEAHKKGRRFQVVVLGARPSPEAADLLSRLVSAGLKCRYGQISSASYVLQGKEVTKVFLGAGALTSNGAVLARAGTAMVAMLAKESGKPVIVFAESYKFSERVLLDSIVLNELGEADRLLMPDSQDGEVSSKDPLYDWRDVPGLKLLNLTYDVTQASLVDLVVTELGNIPPSSVPVVIRERRENQLV